MRFSVNIILDGNAPFFISTSYRKDVYAIIEKSVYNQSRRMHQYYWSTNDETALPFSFSFCIPQHRYVEKDMKRIIQFNSNNLKFLFSSYDHEFLNHVYNGLLKSIQTQTLFGYTASLKNFFFQKLNLINEQSVRFKTISPVAVTKRGKNNSVHFIAFNDVSYIEHLQRSIESLCRHFISQDYTFKSDELKIIPSLCSSAQTDYLSEIISVTRGIIEIAAPVEVLRLIHDAGLGEMRNMGFGMVEVVR
jgi:CRISPR-associated endoribonuclease Cas6